MTKDVFDKFDWNQFEFIANGKKNICLIGKNFKKYRHEFECEFNTTELCDIHAI